MSLPTAETLYELLTAKFSKLLQPATSLVGQSRDTTNNDQLDIYRNCIKIYVFFIDWFLVSSKKSPLGAKIKKRKTKKNDDENQSAVWQSESKLETLLTTIINFLELDLAFLWQASSPEEEFLSVVTKIAFSQLEHPFVNKHKALRRCSFGILATVTKKYQHHVQVTNKLLHYVIQYEHLSTSLVELLELMVKEYDCTQPTGDILREIAKLNPTEIAKDSTGLKNLSIFITELAEKQPQLLRPNISLLLPQLDGESYMIRNGIVQSIGHIINKGFGSDLSSDESALASRNSLLDVLEERFRDVNSYTRSKVLQTWHFLYTQKAVPINRLAKLTKLTIGRLHDKASQVRKNAIHLLTSLLQYNPYAPALPLTQFSEKMKALEERVEKNDSQLKESEEATQSQEAEEKEEVADTQESERQNAEKDQQREVLEEKQAQDAQFLKFYMEAVHFIMQIHHAVPIVAQLMGSKNVSDVQEGISFFVACKKFSIECASIGIAKMLMLVPTTSEQSVKNALISAFSELYLSSEGEDSNYKTARKLISLTENASFGELTALEALMMEFNSSSLISDTLVQCLWDIVAMKQSGKGASTSKGALIVLSMLGKSNPEIIRNKVNILVQVGLGQRGKEDGVVSKYACIGLQALGNTGTAIQRASATTSTFNRFNTDHVVIQKLKELVLERSNALSVWYPGAEQAINAIYTLSDKPDQICAEIVKDMTLAIFPSVCDPSNVSENDVSNVRENTLLCKLFFVIGQVALKQLVYVEEIQSELRRRRSQSHKSQKKKTGQSAIEQELGLDVAAAETEVELLQSKAEKEIVGSNLLAAYIPLLTMVCSNSNMYPDRPLRSSAVLALCKVCCVNANFCEKNLQLLFTILKTAPEPEIRSNIIIALGDLAFRFPNSIEPWNQYLYGRLRDEDEKVRKNTLLVLTHLILNDMIKVKGQISEMAICLEDKDNRIRDLAKLFFFEYANKGNALYNVLPDLMSSLSNAVSSPSSPKKIAHKASVSLPAFENIMKYVFSFIKKDKHTESLVEKICNRFPSTKDWYQWRNMAYCLSLLEYNEKAIKKLIDSQKFYKDKLTDATILSRFEAIVSKTKKFAKPETKALIQELENIISKGVDGTGEHPEADNPAPPPAPTDASNTRSKKKTKRKPTRRGGYVSDSDSEDNDGELSEDEDDFFEAKKKTPARASTRPRRTTARTRTVRDNDSDEEDDETTEETTTSTNTSTRGRRAKGANSKENEPQTKVVKKSKYQSDDDDEDEDAEPVSKKKATKAKPLQARPARRSSRRRT